MSVLRYPSVAGKFYPADRQELESTITRYLALAQTRTGSGVPKAIIVPHAGYIYSGLIAATAYASLIPASSSITRVVLLGPSHFVGFNGLAVTDAERYRTPLGDVFLDTGAITQLLTLPQVSLLNQAHRDEHSLEVQLPFLQTVLKNFILIPLVIGNASTEEIAEVLDLLWGGDETLIVISSDLSHYHDYDSARHLDNATSHAIETLQAELISQEQACGGHGIRGLIRAAATHDLHITTLDLRNSGDTAGSHDRVVGYGAYAAYQ